MDGIGEDIVFEHNREKMEHVWIIRKLWDADRISSPSDVIMVICLTGFWRFPAMEPAKNELPTHQNAGDTEVMPVM